MTLTHTQDRTIRLRVTSPTSWVPPVGSFADLPLSTRFASISPWLPGETSDVNNIADFPGMITDWCAIARVRASGYEGLATFAGGGHSSYGGCDGAYIPLADMTWRRVSQSVGAKFGKPIYRSTADPLNPPTDTKDYVTDATYGEYYSTPDTLAVHGGTALVDSAGNVGIAGSPSASHLYNAITWVPSGTVLGNDPRGYVYISCWIRNNTAQTGQSGYPHYLGLSNDGLSQYGMRGPFWGAPGGYACSFYDSLRKRVVRMASASASGSTGVLRWHDLTPGVVGSPFGSANLRNANDTAGVTVRPGYASGFYWPQKDLYVLVGGFSSSAWQMVLIDPANGYRTYPINVSPAFALPTTGGWELVEETGKLIWFSGVDRSLHVFTAPVEPRLGTWSYNEVVVSGGPAPYTDPSHPHYNKLVYWPTVDAFTWLANGTDSMQALRASI